MLVTKQLGYILLICACISVVLINDDTSQHTISWFMLLLPFITAMVVVLYATPLKERIVAIYLSFLPVYILLSLEYEPLFYSVYFLVLYTFYIIEMDASSTQLKEHLQTTNTHRLYLRLAMFLLLFINTAFFATGNIASFGSFSLPSIYRFTTKFDPFLMGLLLLLKIVIPFIIASVVVYGIVILWDMTPIIVYFISIAFYDLMTIRFFYSIKTIGSWLEMGTSMTQYLIASLFIVILLILYGIAKLMLH